MNHLMMRRKSKTDVKTGDRWHCQEEFGGRSVYRPSGIRRRGGVILIQALIWNAGTCRSNAKGEVRVENLYENKSTDVENRGGTVRSSDEVSVMEMEQRDSVVQCYSLDQPSMMGGIH